LLLIRNRVNKGQKLKAAIKNNNTAKQEDVLLKRVNKQKIKIA